MNFIQKFSVLIIMFVVCIFTISFCYAQNFWQATNGIEGKDVSTLALDSEGRLFAGTNENGIYVSLDDGLNWSQTNSGLTDETIYVIVINYSDHLFAATGSGIFRSSDNGNNWEKIGLSGKKIPALAINSAGHLYAGCTSGIYRSTNGDEWTLKYLGPYSPFSVSCISINSSWHIYFGLWNYLFRSTDNGDNWRKTSTGWGEAHTNVISFNSYDHIYVGTGSGVYLSTDNTSSWIEINNGLINKDVRCVAIHPSGRIFVGTYGGGVYYSDDNGNNWSTINTGLINPFILSLLINSSGHLFAATWGNGVFRSIQPITSVGENETISPQSYVLKQNYPNPFNPVTTIEYQLLKDSHVSLMIFNITGDLVKTLIEEKQSAGYHKIQWNGKDENDNSVAGGLYLCQLKADGFSQSNKMVLIK